MVRLLSFDLSSSGLVLRISFDVDAEAEADTDADADTDVTALKKRFKNIETVIEVLSVVT